MTGPDSPSKCSRPSTRRRKKTLASGRIHVRWLTFLTSRINRQRFHDGKRERFGRRATLRRLLRQTAKVAYGSGFVHGRLAQRDASLLLERHHQLDTIQRRQAKLVQRRVRPHDSVLRVSGEQPLDIVGGRRLFSGALGPALLDPGPNFKPFQLAHRLGARKRSARPHREIPDALMGLQLRVGLTDDRGGIRIRAGARARHARIPHDPRGVQRRRLHVRLAPLQARARHPPETPSDPRTWR